MFSGWGARPLQGEWVTLAATLRSWIQSKNLHETMVILCQPINWFWYAEGDMRQYDTFANNFEIKIFSVYKNVH